MLGVANQHLQLGWMERPEMLPHVLAKLLPRAPQAQLPPLHLQWLLLPGSWSHFSSLLSPCLESLIANPKQVLYDGLAPCPETASEILLDVSNSQQAGGREESQGR